jgi:lambda repressor-like predicted transcriptional regulator
MAGDAREKNVPDHVAYADWVKGIVRDELHKAGWRLADLLTQAVGSTTAIINRPHRLGPNKIAFARSKANAISNSL